LSAASARNTVDLDTPIVSATEQLTLDELRRRRP
jgi:hypothetical protein